MKIAHGTHANEFHQTPEFQTERPFWPSVRRGFGGKCPNCGEGKVFSKALTVVDQCEACGEELHHHRADDLPAYLNILVVGHVVVGVMMIVMMMDWLTLWPLTALTVVIALVCAVLAMRPIKGMVVGAQWALKMHGFGEKND